MTDKVQKIREEVARIQLYTQSAVLKQVLDYIDKVQEEPVSEVDEIAREETIEEVCEWLDSHTMLSEKWYIEDLKKHLENKL